MREPVLLTPGPLTTSSATKLAMVRDWGSRDAGFIELNRRVREMLLDVIQGKDSHVCVPLQGSGTFAVEAMLGTLVPRGGHVLVPVNGAYCRRIARICEILGRRTTLLEYAENQPVKAADIDAALAGESSISHVALVHCETSTCVLNPLGEIASVVAARKKGLLVDAMSSFAALEIRGPFDALVAASGKCLEGVPGMGFVIAKKDVLEKSQGNSHSLAMDLYDQYVYMQKTTQWRFTPPTHVVAALRAAIDQFLAEGGQPARGRRYAENCATLIDGMEKLGFKVFLDKKLQAPIIITFHAPADANYKFADFYQRVRAKGYILYPGKLTALETFRVGCIGAIDSNEMRNVVAAVAETLREMGIKQVAPALAKAA